MGLAQKKIDQLPVSLAKARLLELVRDVERGCAFEITKGGQVVAQLMPPKHFKAFPVTGFAKIKITGDVISPLPVNWSWDKTHLKKKS